MKKKRTDMKVAKRLISLIKENNELKNRIAALEFEKLQESAIRSKMYRQLAEIKRSLGVL